MSAPLLVTSRLLVTFASYAETRGHDISALLSAAGLPSRLEEPPIVELSKLRGLFASIAKHMDEPWLGVRAALATPRGAFGMLEYVARNAPTVADVLRAVASLSALANPHLVVTFDEPSCSFSQLIPGEPIGLGREGNEYAILQYLNVLREIAQPPLVPRRVFFSHERPANDLQPLISALGTARIEFDMASTGVQFTAAALRAPVIAADPALRAILEPQAQVLAEKMRSSGDDITPIRRALAALLPSGEPTAAKVAAMVSMSERSLHRLLAVSGLPFRELVDELRHETAIALLRNTDLEPKRVAERLGYSDARAFARAFKRWTGETPTSFREKPPGSAPR